MRLKLDENIPVGVARLLATLGHDVETVIAEELSGREGSIVWAGAMVAG